jgi:DNA repair exonuclease SbcCD ATPase subunit
MSCSHCQDAYTRREDTLKSMLRGEHVVTNALRAEVAEVRSELARVRVERDQIKRVEFDSLKADANKWREKFHDLREDLDVSEAELARAHIDRDRLISLGESLTATTGSFSAREAWFAAVDEIRAQRAGRARWDAAVAATATNALRAEVAEVRSELARVRVERDETQKDAETVVWQLGGQYDEATKRADRADTQRDRLIEAGEAMRKAGDLASMLGVSESTVKVSRAWDAAVAAARKETP